MNQPGKRVLFTVIASLTLFATAKATANVQPAPAVSAAARTEDWRLVLVNREHPLPEEYPVDSCLADDVTGKELQREAAQQYKAMKDAARQEGIELMLCSGYRSTAYQEGLFEKKKQFYLRKGLDEQAAREAASEVVALPGCSEHNSGLATDIVTPDHQNLDTAFEETEAFRWLSRHAAEYGFILRYPDGKQEITEIIYEPWHYRYVGVENAVKIVNSGLCLEEYLEKLTEK